MCPACPPAPGDLLHSKSQIQVGFFKGLPVPLQTSTPTAPPSRPSTNNPKPAVFHPKLLERSPNRAAQMPHRASNPRHWGILRPAGNLVLMKMLCLAGDRRSLPRCPRSLPSPVSLSHRAGAGQGSSEGSSIPGTAMPGGCGEGQEVAALAPRLGPCFLFRCGWDFPALAVGPRSAPAAALFSISKAAEADGFNATAISSVPKAGGPPPPRDRRAPTGSRGALTEGGGGRAHGHPGTTSVPCGSG